MDTRDTAEQAELRRAARRLARELGPATVAELDDATRSKRLAGAATDAGWLELRDDAGGGEPVAGGVEAAIIADALGAGVADVAFTGPLLAADLARRAGERGTAAVAYPAALTGAAVVRGADTTEPLYAPDCGDRVDAAYVLVPDGSGHRLAHARLAAAGGPGSADLTRSVRTVAAGTPVEPIAGQSRPLTGDDLASWAALGLALTSADLVGVMRGVLDVTVEYAAQRKQFGVPVGSFQAVQHLLADARCLLEGSVSIAAYASWAVDDLDPPDALAAARAAKAYCARSARTVCETAVQVHGGIGNTWECIVHVYLRRALLSTQWFGDDGVQLGVLAGAGAGDGLP